MCPAYIAGLIGPGDRKSVQPMAARLAPGDYDQLHHFVASGVWDAAPLEAELLAKADGLVGGDDACAGHRRHGAAEEGHALGRRRAAICFCAGQERQLPDVGVSDAGPRRGAGHAGLRLFLPESWTSDPPGSDAPAFQMAIVARTKPEIALAEDRPAVALPASASAACWPMPDMA